MLTAGETVRDSYRKPNINIDIIFPKLSIFIEIIKRGIDYIRVFGIGCIRIRMRKVLDLEINDSSRLRSVGMCLLMFKFRYHRTFTHIGCKQRIRRN